MCGPYAVAAVTIISGAIQVQQQRKAADKTNTFNALQADKVRVAAFNAARSKQQALAARTAEQREIAGRDIQSITKQAVKAAGITRLAGAGESVATVLANIAAQEVLGKSEVRDRSKFQDIQAGFESKAAGIEAEGRALAAIKAKIQSPSLLSSGLRLAASGFTAYAGVRLAQGKDVFGGAVAGGTSGALGSGTPTSAAIPTLPAVPAGGISPEAFDYGWRLDRLGSGGDYYQWGIG